MSTSATGAPGAGAASGLPWSLWLRQVRGLARLEIRRIFRGKGSLFLKLLPLFPVVPAVVMWIKPPTIEDYQGIAGASKAFAQEFHAFILPMVCFVACVIVFINLFRKEVLDRSLHYLFLTPVRREVLAAGKFVAAWVAVSTLLSASVAVTYLLLLFPYGGGAMANHLFVELGLAHLLGYIGVTALAVLGYGAVFMAVGLLVKNPFYFTLPFFLWESNSALFPPLLKKFTVSFYLRSLCPVPLSETGLFAILAEPVPAWIAVPGFLLVTAAVLLLAGWRIRGMQISYGDD